MRKPEHSRTLHDLISLAKEMTRVKESRYILVYEWLWKAIYGEPTEEQMEKILIYLEMQRIMSGLRGIDTTKDEKRLLQYLDRVCMEKIKEIHEGYYLSIKTQEDEVQPSRQSGQTEGDSQIQEATRRQEEGGDQGAQTT